MKKGAVIFYLTFIFALWFMLTSSFWIYYINLFISFPFGLISFLLWLKFRKYYTNIKRTSILSMLIIGVLIAVKSLIILL